MIQEVLEGDVICADGEGASPQVWLPMADGLDETDESSRS